MSIKIDKEFKALLQPLSKEEYEQLRQNLIADGCREPLVLWGEIIVDGHNRFEICSTNTIPYKTVQKDFADRQAAMDWIDKNQLGRRNLTKEQMSLIRGRRYNRNKNTRGVRFDPKQMCKNATSDEHGTASIIAKEHGVHSRTISKDAVFASAVETLKPLHDVEKDIQEKKKVVKEHTIAAAKAYADGDTEKAKHILKKGTKKPVVPELPKDTDGKMKAIFEQAKIFDKWDKEILAIQREVLDNYGTNPALACLYQPFFKQAITKLRNELKLTRPIEICNQCHGKGCDECRNLGFLTERTKKNGQ